MKKGKNAGKACGKGFKEGNMCGVHKKSAKKVKSASPKAKSASPKAKSASLKVKSASRSESFDMPSE
jgi:hypothetical protein